MDKLDFIKINNFCSSKSIFKKIRQTTLQEKIFAITMSENIHIKTKYMTSTNQKKKNPNKIWSKDCTKENT